MFFKNNLIHNKSIAFNYLKLRSENVLGYQC